MAGRRRVAPEVQKLFDKYTPDGVIARRLPRENALRLLDVELGMTGARAEELFDHFDADQNGYMSLWEFQHFVNVIGASQERCTALIANFERAAGGGNSTLSAEQVRATLDSLTLPSGEPFNDKEKDFFMSSSGADMGEFTFGQFADLLARIRLYKRPQKK